MTNTPTPSTSRRDSRFWFVAFAFMVVMAFATVPTPLWSSFAQRDHLSSLTITIVFAAYAVAVALSLFLADISPTGTGDGGWWVWAWR